MLLLISSKALFPTLAMLTLILWSEYDADLRTQLEDQRRRGANHSFSTCSMKKGEEAEQMRHPDHPYDEILDTGTW